MLSSQVMQLRCGSCRALFSEDTPVNVRVELWIGFVSAIRCPSCGSDKILMGQDRTRSEDAGFEWGDGLAARISGWRANGEKGQSSEAIFQRMTGQRQAIDSHPHDVSDLRRCVLLLDRIPEWSARMPEMAGVSKTWERLSASWEDLVTCFVSEAGPDLDLFPLPRTHALLEAWVEGRGAPAGAGA